MSKQSALVDCAYKLVLAVFCLWGFGWLLVGAYYCNPNAEDIFLTVDSRDVGIIYSVKALLASMDGRYFTNLLHTINPLAFGWIYGYKLMPVVSLLLFIFSFFFLLTSFAGNRYFLFSITLLLTLVFIALSPSLPHQLYWMVSSFVYFWTWCFTFIWIGSFVRFIKSTENKVEISWFLVAIISMVCAIGMNEMFLIINGIIITIMLIYAVITSRIKLIKTIPLALTGITAILFFISSPGIISRMNKNKVENKNLVDSGLIIQTLSDYKDTVLHLFESGILICVILFMVANAEKIYDKMLNYKTKNILYVIAAFFLVAYLMNFAFYIPMQKEAGYYPARIYNSSILPILIALVFFFPFLIYKVLYKKNWYLLFRNKIISPLILIVMLGFTLLSENNISNIKTEFDNGIFQSYDNQMQKRYKILQRSNSEVECWKLAIVDKITNMPLTISSYPDIEPNRNPQVWNIAYEKYFKLNEVRLRNDTIYKSLYIRN